MRMEFKQSEEENRRAFVARLMKAGWTRRDAAKEWERIQEEDESGE